MIAADANFQAAELRQTLRPYFDAFFAPYFYPVEIDDWTLVNCVFESAGGYLPVEGDDGFGGFGDFGFGDYPWGDGAPAVEALAPSGSGVRIVVVYGSTSASATSPIITNPAEVLPSSPVPSWDINYPGYGITVQYRTSNNINQIPYLAWTTLTENVAVDLYHYYQIRFVWAMIRAWACDSLADANAFAYSAWAIDSLPSDHASYACEGDGDLSYLDNLELEGEYQVNPDDIADMGELSEELGAEFGKLVASEHTLILINRDNKFTPGHINFIFKETDWRRKGVRISMAYERGGGAAVNLYKGTVIDWGPRRVSIDPDMKVAEKTVEVYSQSLAAKLLETQVGVTDDDGIPHPFVCGEILHELVQLANESPNEPEKTVGTIEDFSATQIMGTNNTLTNNTTETVKGMDSIKCRVETGGGIGGQGAIGYLDLALPHNKLLLSAWIMFKTIPATINNNGTNFFGFQKADGTTQFYLTVGSDTRVNVGIGAEIKETSWYLNQDPGVWKRVSIAFAGLPDIGGDKYGIAKIWVNGEEVFSQTDGDFSLWASMRRGMAGLWDSFSGETWEVYFADVQISSGWEPYAYRLYGEPYQSIGSIYQDGAIQQETRQITQSAPPNIVTTRGIFGLFTKVYTPGPVVDTELITKSPRKGLIVFNDYANPPSGTIFARARKDDNTHPVEVIRAILEEADLDSAIDGPNFDAARALISTDSIGCWFEDMTLGDCLSAIGSRCLINILATLDKVRLLAYVGTAGTPVATLEDWAGYEHSIKTQEIVSRVKVQWGWYERNKLLSYIARNEAAVSAVGLKDEQIDLTWGQEVASDNEGMAKQKADWWLKRICGDKEVLESFVNPYSAARLECGDTVTVTSDDLFDTPNFMIVSKSMKLSPDYDLSFQAEKYLGEI